MNTQQSEQTKDALYRELAWWREVFACRFADDNLPPVGTPLYGHRLQIRVQDPAGEWVKWRNDGR